MERQTGAFGKFWGMVAAAAAGTLVLASCTAWPTTESAQAASGGDIAIDQAHALKGGISRGDAPGFPVTLSAPGLYKLTSDLVVPLGATGIVITAPGVTLDLNGFAVRGPVACRAEVAVVQCNSDAVHGQSGIHATAGGVVVRHGSVRGFAGPGLKLAADALVEDLELSGNAEYGLHANTSASRAVRVRNVKAYGNGADGFWLQTGRIESSRAEGNGRAGFALGALATVKDASAVGNKGLEGNALPRS